MQEENRKEILTRRNIRKELKEVYLYNGLIHLLHLAGYILCFVIVYILGQNLLEDRIANFSQVSVTLINIMTIVLLMFFIIICGWAFYGVCKFWGLLITTSKNKFNVVIDKLTDSKKLISHNDQVMVEEVSDHKIRPVVYLYKQIVPSSHQYKYKFYFEKHKEYDLPEGKFYHWSEMNSMNDWQIFRSADIGDEFYLVVANGKVLYVYNTKHFELQE